MKLEIGQYIRTKNGIIDKVILNYNSKCASPNCNCKHVSCEKDYYDEDKITKASHNIIDLIEVGDVVKYRELTFNSINNFSGEYVGDIHNKEILNNIKIEIEKGHIKLLGVLTHEQFENNCYKIGD